MNRIIIAAVIGVMLLSGATMASNHPPAGGSYSGPQNKDDLMDSLRDNTTRGQGGGNGVLRSWDTRDTSNDGGGCSNCGYGINR